ncbi:MAG: hypothetical protein IKE55_07720 [Kiritimatiellae bacterium]|nr:hypothetical protein [Kiritimatiellia bacterium]
MNGNYAAAAVAAMIACGALADAPEQASWPAERKKVVYMGADMSGVTAAEILRHADEFERSGVDGIGFVATVRNASGEKVGTSAYVLDSTNKWTREMLSGQVPDLKKALKHKGLRESLIWTVAMPHGRRIDWGDDARWECIAHNMGIIGWFVRETGLRGIYVDPEDYTKLDQFHRHDGDAPWEDLAVLARKRSRQIFTPLFRECPDAVVLGYWLFSWDARHSLSRSPMTSVRLANDLWPSFVNGMLDAVPEKGGARLVDGNEWAYQYDAADNEFAISLVAQLGFQYGLVAPENRDTFRRCYRPGFGVYIMSYLNSGKGKEAAYYFPPYRGSRLGYFERNLAEMARCAGEYVWLWDDNYSWIKWDDERKLPTGRWGVSRESWGEKLPGVYSIVRACFNPEEFLRVDYPELRGSGRMTNLVEGVDFVQMSRVALYGPTGRKEDGKKGDGWFIHQIKDVKPGTHYVIEAEGLGERLQVVIAWRRKLPEGRVKYANRWFDPRRTVPMKPVGGGRQRCADVVAVPEGADTLSFEVDIMPNPGQDCYVDKVFIGEVPVK